MKTALITGSETFGKYITNPSKWLALAVDGKVVADYKTHSLILPSIVLVPQGMEDPGKSIVKTAERLGADVIISFGMSSGVRGFQLERLATNWIYNEKYLTPEENNQPLDQTRPPKEQVQLDLSHWDLEQMKMLFNEAGIPFDPTISDDAGQYSCNSWIYRTLLATQETKAKIPSLFVHMACTKEAIELISDFDRANKVLIRKEDTIKTLEFVLRSFKG